MTSAKRPVVRLSVLQAETPKPRGWLRRTPDAVFFTGDGTTDHACGDCGHVILRGVSRAQLSGMAFECPACGALNH